MGRKLCNNNPVFQSLFAERVHTRLLRREVNNCQVEYQSR